MTSQIAALAHAETVTGDVVHVTPDPRGWGFATYSAHHRAWWGATPSGYYNDVMRQRSYVVAAEAFAYLRPGVASADALDWLHHAHQAPRGGARACLRYLLRSYPHNR